MHHYQGNAVAGSETQSYSLTWSSMRYVQSYNGTFAIAVHKSLSLEAVSVENCVVILQTRWLFTPQTAQVNTDSRKNHLSILESELISILHISIGKKTAKATLWGPLVKFSHRNTNTNDWSHIFAENKTNLTSVFRLAGTLQHSSTSERLEIFYYLFESS